MNAHLSADRLQQLRASAIRDDVIAARGYRTIENPNELKALGFAPKQRRACGLLPVRTTDGGNGLSVYRPDTPPRD